MPVKGMRALPADGYVALALIVMGGLVLHELWTSDMTGPYATPATLPMFVVTVLLILSFLLLASALIRPACQAAAGVDFAGLARVAALGIGTAAYIHVIPMLGYLLSSGLFVLGAGLIFGNRKPLSLLATAILTPVLLKLFFEKVMLIFLPSSSWIG